MKTYKAKSRISPQLREVIEKTVEFNERYGKAYFWQSRGNAADRRYQEKRFARENPEYDIETGSGLIEVRPHLRLSAKNVYYSLTVAFDGKKSNISRLKRLVNGG